MVVSVIRSSRWLDVVRTFSALSGHSQKPFWFLLLLIFAVAANSSGDTLLNSGCQYVLYRYVWRCSRCEVLFAFSLIPTEYMFILHSFSILLDDRSKTFCKTLLPHSAIQSFLIQMRISTPVLNPLRTIRIVGQHLWF